MPPVTRQRRPPRSVPVSLPSPWGGINTRDGIAALQPNEARDLRNWVPSGNSLVPRKGRTTYSTGGAAAAVETLAAFNGLTTSILIGVNGGSIYDFTGTSAILLSAAGYTESRFQTECYNNRLIGVNGVDTPWAFDGSSVGATGFTGSGLTLSNLVNIGKAHTRLWFCENNSADVWYGGVGSITGTLTKFQLSQVVAGGYCMAIGAHSQDGGNGPDDYTVFVMSTGEVVIYSGDPATTFSKVGNFSMPPPVGRHCLVSIGGQVAVLTRMGLVPIAAAMQGIAFDAVAIGPFGKVAPSFVSDTAMYGSNEGWEMAFWNGLVLINVPYLAGAASREWVYNTTAPSWTQLYDINPSCMCVWEGDLYVGSWDSGTIYRYSGSSDDGASINLTARQAFGPEGNANLFQATAIRFDMAVEGTLSGRFGLDLDYIARDIDIPSVDIAASISSTPWGSVWDSAWSTSSQYSGQWFSTYGLARTMGIALEASTVATRLEWYSSQILAERAGIF